MFAVKIIRMTILVLKKILKMSRKYLLGSLIEINPEDFLYHSFPTEENREDISYVNFPIETNPKNIFIPSKISIRFSYRDKS